MIFKKKKVFNKIETDFSAKIGNSNVFSAQKQVIFKKKRSSPKLRLIFRPKSEIQTLFQAESRHVLHNFGTQFPLGGLFSIFHQKSASKAPKTCDFAYFTSQWGGSSPLPPSSWLRYCVSCSSDWRRSDIIGPFDRFQLPCFGQINMFPYGKASPKYPFLCRIM